jgi:hypothetical protein
MNMKHSLGERLARLKTPGDQCLAAVLGVLAVFALLQVWRPLFFLTDDTLTLFYPVLAECGRTLAGGGTFWISGCLFGGGYSLAADSMYVGLFHPLVLPLSLLAPLRTGLAVMDLLCLGNLILSATGMVLLLTVLRRRGLASFDGGWVVFAALSYTFSMYALLLGSSGAWYLSNMAALPWMILSLFLGGWRGALLLAAAVFHAIVGGYPSCTIYSGLLLGILAVWKAARDRSPGPVLLAAGGGCLGAVLAAPLLWPALTALSDSTRGGALPVEIASEHAMPAAVLLVSAFGSVASAFAGRFELFGVSGHAYALASSPAAWLAVAACWGARRLNGWDRMLIGCGILAALLVSRPAWLGGIIAQVPVLGSLRWPHKEIFLFVFLLHLWLARGSRIDPKWLPRIAAAGTLFFVLPLLWLGPPSLALDGARNRDMVLSGRAAAYWDKVSGLLAPGERIACVMPDGLIGDPVAYSAAPSLLAGIGNFPALYGIPSWSGYSATMPRRIFLREPRAATVHGVFRESDLPGLLAQPGVVALRLRPGGAGGWEVDMIRPGSVRPVPAEWIAAALPPRA